MCSNRDPIFLLRDTVLTSERNGTEKIYWSQRELWSALRGARGVEVSWALLSYLGSPTVRLFLQYSADGLTWRDAQDSGGVWVDANDVSQSYGLLGAAITRSTMTSGSMRIALSHQVAGAAFVRVGVQVAEDSESPSSQVEARLTMAMSPCHGGGDVPLAVGGVLGGTWPDDGDVIGPIFSGIDVDGVTLVADIGGATSDQLVLDLQTASDPDGTWVDTGVQVDLLVGTRDTVLTSAGSGVVGTWLRLAVSGSPTVATTGTFNVVATVRMR